MTTLKEARKKGLEPTFSTDLRQVGDGLLVRRPQRAPEPALGF